MGALTGAVGHVGSSGRPSGVAGALVAADDVAGTDERSDLTEQRPSRAGGTRWLIRRGSGTEALGKPDGSALVRGPLDGLEQVVKSHRITEVRLEG